MGVREFWLLASFFLVALRRALTVAWIRVNKFLSSPDWLIRPVSDFRHKVCLMWCTHLKRLIWPSEPL